MAKLAKTAVSTKTSSKITKRELLLSTLGTMLSEQFEQEVKATKEGLVVAFENEKGEVKDFVFRIVEKKDRIKKDDFL